MVWQHNMQIKIKGIYQPDTIAKWYPHSRFQTVLTNGPYTKNTLRTPCKNH